MKKGGDSTFASDDWRHRVFELEQNVLSYAITKEGDELGRIELTGADVTSHVCCVERAQLLCR